MVAVTKPTHLAITEVLADNPHLAGILMSPIRIEECNGQVNEEPAVKELASMKKDIYDEVLIINGSNCYDDFKKGLPNNIKILDESSALKHIKENWKR